MSETIWGILQMPDADASVQAVGQNIVYDAVQEFVRRQNAAVELALRTFVGSTTTEHEATYETPGGGMMQEADRLTRPAAVKRLGRYSIGFPIRDARDQIAGDDITLAYMTLQQLQTHINNVFVRHLNWVRFNVLKALLNKTNESFYDEPLEKTITVRRLANSDGTIYAPTITGAEGAEDNHYLVSGFAAASISDVNNPFTTLRAEISEHFGEGNLVTWVNEAHTTKISGLADFIPFGDPRVSRPLGSEAIIGSAPSVPGNVIGRIGRQWISEWSSMPENYLFTLDLDQEPPLRKRIDAPTAIAGRGQLALVARQQEFPLQESFWRDRHGYGVANRLNGVVMELTADATYDTPAAYQ